MSETKVANKYAHKPTESDVYIGRPSKWGNPFRLGVDGDRDEVVDKYERWIKTQPQLMASLQELKGRTLVCWCKPRRCHGDVLKTLCEMQNTGPAD